MKQRIIIDIEYTHSTIKNIIIKQNDMDCLILLSDIKNKQ